MDYFTSIVWPLSYAFWNMWGFGSFTRENTDFKNTYHENTDVFIVDENGTITRGKRRKTEGLQLSKAGAKQHVSTHSAYTLTQDELLIELVRVRRALWDHSIPSNERTKLKKDKLWQQIVNAFDESFTVEIIKQRWEHLRDSYVKAKKKMQEYTSIRSGLEAESGHPLQSSFSHYERMRFLDNVEKIAPSIQHFLKMPSSHNDVQIDTMQENNLDNFDDSTMDSAYPSEISQTSSCSSIRAEKNNVQRQAETEKKFLSMIDEKLSQKKRDAVDSYLEQLGDILRRLPYIQRRNLQRKILDIAIEEEDIMFAERENAN